MWVCVCLSLSKYNRYMQLYLQRERELRMCTYIGTKWLGEYYIARRWNYEMDCKFGQWVKAICRFKFDKHTT